MKEFRNYIIHNCNCRGSDYKDYFLTNISFILLDKIVFLFDLDETMLIETMLIENELYL
jgi:hypothetical protein